MDISALKTTDRTVEILHPGSGEPIGIRVSVVSIEDDKLQKLKRQITDRNNASTLRGKVVKAEEIEDNENSILFAATTDWEWYTPDGGDAPSFHGETPDFNRKNFMAVIGELPWFRSQLIEAIGETKAFFANSKRS